VPKSAALLAVCPLAHAASGGCAWCGSSLPPRRRTWCADACATAFWNNHWWTAARAAAKRRDRYRCVRCGERAPVRPTRKRHSSERAYRDAMRAWRAARKTGRVEVNHRVPCRGKHRTLGCEHHLENLETLCAACHKAETAADARERQLARGAA